MSLLSKLAEARAELEAHHEDPWRSKVAAAVRIRSTHTTKTV